jgi:hypothetical protein
MLAPIGEVMVQFTPVTTTARTKGLASVELAIRFARVSLVAASKALGLVHTPALIKKRTVPGLHTEVL